MLRGPVLIGAASLLLGLGLLVVAISLASVTWFFVGSVILGAGWGILYSGAFGSLSALADPAHRGELLAAVYLIAYLSMCLPVVGAGFAISRFGLHDRSLRSARR